MCVRACLFLVHGAPQAPRACATRASKRACQRARTRASAHCPPRISARCGKHVAGSRLRPLYPALISESTLSGTYLGIFADMQL